MVGTSFIILTAILSRILEHSFGTANIEPYDFFIPLYLGVITSALLLVNDILKKNSPVPYTIVTVALLLNIIIFYARYTEAWQSVVRLVGDNIF